MAAPIINNTQSVLGYLQHEYFEFQPYAFNSPDWWTSSPLPPGLTLNTTTGKISGAVTKPGVFVFALQAGNAAGTSEAVVFTAGIEASASSVNSSAIDIFIDLTTRLVGVSSQNFAYPDAQKPQPLLRVKRGDDLLFNLQFVKGGAVTDLDLVSLKFSLKELEPESVLVASSAWRQMNTGSDANYKLYTLCDSDLLSAALSDYEDDAGTTFPALAEFEWIERNPDEPAVGAPLLRTSSQTFIVEIDRDIIPNG